MDSGSNTGTNTPVPPPTASTSKPTKVKESAFIAKPTLVVRSTKYKEKFNAMKEKYERVNGIHDAHQKELDTAKEKLRLLQEENNLLLDAIHHSLEYEPSIANNLRVIYEEDRREKWIRDHPEEYQRLQSQQSGDVDMDVMPASAEQVS
ncbi:hypothetical protein BDV98DRAFT_567244 [Pterulicium gracile]|uniref:Uncharacterized protein n=1 Tax=Pterulicium gracile TaxID=1884261 RepID=A0A5C3QHR7_9AGAR|nr:hypothetical protein BDV98DRAFT_567244 [Pterula gracilis]